MILREQVLRLLSHNQPYRPEQTALIRDFKIPVNCITEIYGLTDSLQRQISAQASVVITNPLQANQIFIGSAANVATAMPVTGDISIVASGLTTIQPNVVSYSKIQQVAAASLLGNPTGALANVQGITLGAGLSFVGSALTATGGTPTLTSTQIAYGDGANLMTSAATFTKTTAKITFTGDGTGALGSLYLTRGDSVNQYIVLHENVASPNSAYLTFKSSGGNAVGQGVIFAAGAPVSYVFTDPSGVPLNTIDATTGANTIANLAGVGSRMVVASAAGVLSAAAIPTNTTIVNDPNWTLLGQLVYGTGAATGAILAGHTNADNRYLRQTGTGAASAAPAWVRLDAGDITTGIILPTNGGTGIANNAASTLTISGNFATTLTVTGATGVTLPTSGTLYGTAANSITSAQLSNSLTDETGTGVAVFGTQPTLNSPILAAGTATAGTAPLYFTPTAAVLLIAAVAGTAEVDAGGIGYYTHAASERGVIDAEQFMTLTAAYTLASQTAVQKLFNTPTNGTLTVTSSKTYFFECVFSLTGMSSTSGNFGFALGGAATYTSVMWQSTATKSANLTNGQAAASTTVNITTANTTVSTNSIATNGAARIYGIIRVNAGGTLIPMVSFTTVAGAVTPIVGIDSYFRIWSAGTNLVVSVGNWS